METSPARARATLVATVTTLPAGSAVPIVSDLEGVDWLEIRADLVGDLDAARLARVFPGKLLYTLRSRAEGGGSEGTPERRRQRLIEAAGRYDYVDLEAARDLTPDILKGVPAEKRVISWHGPAPGVDGLTATFERMAAVPAALYKLVPTAAQAGEEVQALLLLASLGRRDVAAFAAGAIGAWTRLVAPRLGAPVVYGALGEVPGAPGQISIERLRRDYGLPELPPDRGAVRPGRQPRHPLALPAHPQRRLPRAGHPGGLPAVPRRLASATSGWRWWRTRGWRRSGSPSAASR